jgi:hypothetical protein
MIIPLAIARGSVMALCVSESLRAIVKQTGAEKTEGVTQPLLSSLCPL